MDIAVIGNSAVNTGFAMAGHSVRVASWPGAEASHEPINRRGGISTSPAIPPSRSAVSSASPSQQ